MTVWQVEWHEVYTFCVEAKNREQAYQMAVQVRGEREAPDYNEQVIRPAKPEERADGVYEMSDLPLPYDIDL